MQAAHGHHHTPAVDSAGAAHGSLKTYLIGFIASVILTVIPFWMVMHPAYAHSTIVAVIVALAVVQIMVHLVYFLHLNGNSELRWNNIALAFSVIVVVILIGGTVWIMNSAAMNMTPIPDLTHQE